MPLDAPCDATRGRAELPDRGNHVTPRRAPRLAFCASRDRSAVRRAPDVGLLPISRPCIGTRVHPAPSMGPRAEARGNTEAPDDVRAVADASMRPRAEARGNRAGRSCRAAPPKCFNEASCRSTRKPVEVVTLRGDLFIASMRPRAEARGNGRTAPRRRAGQRGFNEASCRSTRKPKEDQARLSWEPALQ